MVDEWTVLGCLDYATTIVRHDNYGVEKRDKQTLHEIIKILKGCTGCYYTL